VCWFLYLIRTADNRLYTGITTDVPRRFRQHQAGKGAKALRGKATCSWPLARKLVNTHLRCGWNIVLSS
jgi:predicted GIY-YIG superfamily endonuclease